MAAGDDTVPYGQGSDSGSAGGLEKCESKVDSAYPSQQEGSVADSQGVGLKSLSQVLVRIMMGARLKKYPQAQALYARHAVAWGDASDSARSQAALRALG